MTCQYASSGCNSPEGECLGLCMKAEPDANQQLRQALIKTMVDRFLGWKLPEDFAPDCGISFKRESDYAHPVYGRNKFEPTGTNLFNAEQARAMLEYLLPADALTAGQREPEELDAWECPECGGAGRRTVYHKVTHLLGSDELPFLDECEVCGGIGSCGPDAEKRAAIKAAINQGQGVKK